MRWAYKTVHYEMKKEGLLGSAFLDESEIELSLNEYGKAGWELVAVLETLDGLIAVFKQPLGLDSGIMPRVGTEAAAAPQAVAAPKPLQARPETKPEPRRLEEKKGRAGAEPEIVLIDDFEEDREEPAVEVTKTSADGSDVGSIRIE